MTIRTQNTDLQGFCLGLWCLTPLSTIFYFYLTFCTFSVEINESLIQDVVSPHCGDKRMAGRCTRRFLPNYFVMTSYHWNVRQNTATWHWWMNGKIMWRHVQNVVSLEVLSHFNSTLVICLNLIVVYRVYFTNFHRNENYWRTRDDDW